jgi:DNA-binding response OmpR family regulator
MSADTKILLVEDDLNLGFVIQDALKMNHFKVTLAKDGKEGLKVFSENEFDICLFDVMLPKKDGFSLAEDVRKLNQNIPIIFLTAKSQTEDKIKGFKLGADDYITKPFNMDELILRIEAILKRSSGSSTTESQFNFSIGTYEFDSANYILSRDNVAKTLTKKEADILKILCEQKGKVVERELILNMVWGDDSYFNGRSLDVFITKLRKYLIDDASVTIKNIHGVGFSLEDANS